MPTVPQTAQQDQMKPTTASQSLPPLLKKKIDFLSQATRDCMDIPDDILYEIGSQLWGGDLASLASACKHFLQAFRDRMVLMHDAMLRLRHIRHKYRPQATLKAVTVF